MIDEQIKRCGTRLEEYETVFVFVGNVDVLSYVCENELIFNAACLKGGII